MPNPNRLSMLDARWVVNAWCSLGGVGKTDHVYLLRYPPQYPGELTQLALLWKFFSSIL